MSGADIPLTLNRLPIEVIQAIATMLPLPHMKEFSCVNKKLRNVCLPFLFCQITLNFSEIEERDLRWIISSGLRHCVKSFTYVVPDLLSRDILSFDTFRSSSFTPHDYIEVIREPYDYHEAAAYPSYMTIYNSIRTICEEQHHIKDNHHDSTLLSSVFAALPRLKELRLSCVAMADCVDSHLILATKTDHSSYEHHFQVVATALRAARDQGIYIDVVELSGLDLPYYYGLPETQPRSAVKELLNDIKILRVHRCNHALLSFLSRCVLKIRQLDMCTLHLHERDVFHDLLQTNWIFLCFIGVHNVVWTTCNQHLPWETVGEKLTPDLLCNILNVQKQPGFWKKYRCSCLASCKYRKGSWRLDFEALCEGSNNNHIGS